MERRFDQRHVGAGHEFFDVQQDERPFIDRPQTGDVLGVERRGGAVCSMR